MRRPAIRRPTSCAAVCRAVPMMEITAPIRRVPIRPRRFPIGHENRQPTAPPAVYYVKCMLDSIRAWGPGVAHSRNDGTQHGGTRVKERLEVILGLSSPEDALITGVSKRSSGSKCIGWSPYQSRSPIRASRCRQRWLRSVSLHPRQLVRRLAYRRSN